MYRVLKAKVLELLPFIIRSDEGLMLETSASETLYGGQFTLSTQFIKLNYIMIPPADVTPQFVLKSTPFRL